MEIGADNSGRVRSLWNFWRGNISAGPGPAAVAAPMTPTGVGQDGQGGGSVDSQTYPFTVVGGSAPQLLVARQPSRRSLSIENNGLSTLFIFFGPNSQNVANPALGIAIAPGIPYQPPAGVPVDEIYGWTSGVSTSGVIITGS